MTDDRKSPAASIADVDLAAIEKQNPAAAREISRLGERLAGGEESNEDFRALCQLLYDAGEKASAEHLLRRNLEYYEGHAQYSELFGTAKQEEFDSSIESFKSQFHVELEFVKHHDFLDDVYRIWQHALPDVGSQRFAIGNTVNFSYSLPNVIEAEIEDPVGEVSLCLSWVNGVWEATDA